MSLFNSGAALFAPDNFFLGSGEKNPTPFQPQQVLTGAYQGQTKGDWDRSLNSMYMPFDALGYYLYWGDKPLIGGMQDYSIPRLLGFSQRDPSSVGQSAPYTGRRMDPGQLYRRS